MMWQENAAWAACLIAIWLHARKNAVSLFCYDLVAALPIGAIEGNSWEASGAGVGY
jgi:hypothetical protein